jgi:hypothetical protein
MSVLGRRLLLLCQLMELNSDWKSSKRSLLFWHFDVFLQTELGNNYKTEKQKKHVFVNDQGRNQSVIWRGVNIQTFSCSFRHFFFEMNQTTTVFKRTSYGRDEYMNIWVYEYATLYPQWHCSFAQKLWYLNNIIAHIRLYVTFSEFWLQ